MSHIACDHPGDHWEVNPKTKVYTLRCTRCGNILQTYTKPETEEKS